MKLKEILRDKPHPLESFDTMDIETLNDDIYLNDFNINYFINEVLTKSVNFELLTREVDKIFIFDDMFFDDKKGKYFIQTEKDITLKEFDTITSRCETLGWFISAIKLINNQGNDEMLKPPIFKQNINEPSKLIKYKDTIYLQIEPNFDTRIVIEDVKNLYHISFDIFHKNIMKQGLIPKNKNKLSNHPSRIYLLMNVDDTRIKFIAKKLIDHYVNRQSVNKIYVYNIHRGIVKSNSIYSDINLRDGGVYTEGVIPSHFLDVYMSADYYSKTGEITWLDK
jgi:hypothetical protein